MRRAEKGEWRGRKERRDEEGKVIDSKGNGRSEY
jgi:hypothetical protein